MPPGVYFKSDFSILAWVYLKTIRYAGRLIDFGNGAQIDNVFVMTCMAGTGRGVIRVVYSGQDIIDMPTINQLPLNQWIHLGITFTKPNAYFYINGQLETTFTQSGSGIYPQDIVRTSNFIGRSNWLSVAADEDADGYFDDLKIFNRGLSQPDLIFEMNNYI